MRQKWSRKARTDALNLFVTQWFRFQHKKFDEMRCKLDSIENSSHLNFGRIEFAALPRKENRQTVRECKRFTGVIRYNRDCTTLVYFAAICMLDPLTRINSFKPFLFSFSAGGSSSLRLSIAYTSFFAGCALPLKLISPRQFRSRLSKLSFTLRREC